MMTVFLTAPAESRIHTTRRILLAREFIDRHFAQPLTINTLAGEACLSPFHFGRTFKAIFSVTPHQYLTLIRIKEAKKMMGTDLSLMEICGKVGFESFGSFCRLFKKYTGLPPAQYRQSIMLAAAERNFHPEKFIPACFGDNFS